MSSYKKLNGVWNLEKNEMFEEFLTEVGIGWMTRKAILAASNKQTITLKDDGLKILIETLKTVETDIKYGVEVEMDFGKSVTTLEGDVLVTKTKKDNLDITQKRYVDKNDVMVLEFHVNKISAKRLFKRLQ